VDVAVDFANGTLEYLTGVEECVETVLAFDLVHDLVVATLGLGGIQRVLRGSVGGDTRMNALLA
jgi:hypothetical protein